MNFINSKLNCDVDAIPVITVKLNSNRIVSSGVRTSNSNKSGMFTEIKGTGNEVKAKDFKLEERIYDPIIKPKNSMSGKLSEVKNTIGNSTENIFKIDQRYSNALTKPKNDFKISTLGSIEDSYAIDNTKTLKRRVSRVRRKKVSDIYESGSDFDEIDSGSERKKSKNYDSDPDFNEIPLISNGYKTESDIGDFELIEKISSTSKKQKFEMEFNQSYPSKETNVNVESFDEISLIEDEACGYQLPTPKVEEGVTKKATKKVSDKLKRMIVDSIEAGVCNRQTAASVFKVPYSTVVHIYKKFLESGVVEKQNRDLKLQDEQVTFLADTLAENCTYSIKELTAMVSSKYSIEVSNASVSKKISAFHYNVKRVDDCQINEITSEIINDHKEYCQLFLELCNIGRPIIYFDDAEFTLLMRRFGGRVDPGIKGQVTAPSLRTRHRSVMLALSNDGVILHKTLEQTRSRSDLIEYLRELFRSLKKQNKSDAILVMGSASFVHCDAIKDLAQAEGHQLLFLPSNNKWFNPVESLLCQWPALVRSKKPDNEKRLEQTVDTLGAQMSAKRCQECCAVVLANVEACVADTLDYGDK